MHYSLTGNRLAAAPGFSITPLHGQGGDTPSLTTQKNRARYGNAPYRYHRRPGGPRALRWSRPALPAASFKRSPGHRITNPSLFPPR